MSTKVVLVCAADIEPSNAEKVIRDAADWEAAVNLCAPAGLVGYMLRAFSFIGCDGRVVFVSVPQEQSYLVTEKRVESAVLSLREALGKKLWMQVELIGAIH